MRPLPDRDEDEERAEHELQDAHPGRRRTAVVAGVGRTDHHEHQDPDEGEAHEPADDEGRAVHPGLPGDQHEDDGDDRQGAQRHADGQRQDLADRVTHAAPCVLPRGAPSPATGDAPRAPRPHGGQDRRRRDEVANVASRYEIRVRGRLSRTLAAEFAQLDLSAETEPIETVLHGPVEDQAALYGLLRRIESLGLELLEVRRAATSDDGCSRPS